MATPPLVVIVGQTGTGKSDLAILLAERFNGEIIAADSRTVYQGMDIGTAKPSKDEQAKIRHHLLDIVQPHQKFSAAEFKKLANKAIEDITNRSKLPILVGGTGLYIDSVIYNYDFNPEGERDLVNPRHRLNPPSNRQLRENTLIIGLKVEREELEERLTQRIDKMVDDGLVNEIRSLLAKYSAGLEAFRAPGYKAFIGFINGQKSMVQAKNEFLKSDLQLAKRQNTWFKRNKSIQWFNSDSDPRYIVEQVTTFLNK